MSERQIHGQKRQSDLASIETRRSDALVVIGVVFAGVLLLFFITAFYTTPNFTPDQRFIARFLLPLLFGSAAGLISGTALLKMRIGAAGATTVLSATSGLALVIMTYLLAPYWDRPGRSEVSIVPASTPQRGTPAATPTTGAQSTAQAALITTSTIAVGPLPAPTPAIEGAWTSSNAMLSISFNVLNGVIQDLAVSLQYGRSENCGEAPGYANVVVSGHSLGSLALADNGFDTTIRAVFAQVTSNHFNLRGKFQTSTVAIGELDFVPENQTKQDGSVPCLGERLGLTWTAAKSPTLAP
ncbi:MAG TPA: hypothetical protein VKV73_04000 [Chloroflexota bacterium]|nr:hypothetical protein [Chloroflexota bacterium]